MTAFDAVERPLTIAEIFDRAVVLCVRKWRIAVVLSLAVALPSTVLRAIGGGRLPGGYAGYWGTLLIEVPIVAFFSAALVRAYGEPGAPAKFGRLLRGAARDYRRALPSYALVTLLFYAALVLVETVVAAAFAAGGVAMGAVFAALAGSALLAVSVPLGTVVLLAYPTTVLEGVGAWRGLVLTFERVRSGTFARAWLLGAALLTVWLGPMILVSSGIDRAAMLTDWWWLRLAEPAMSVLAGWPYSGAASVVAAIDFRLRREGADLQAALEHVSA